MELKERYLRAYLTLVIVFGFLGVMDSLFTLFNVRDTLFFTILTLAFFFFFFYNVIFLFIFRCYKVEWIVYALPIYHVASYLLLTLLVILVQGNVIGWGWFSLMVFSFSSSFFEMLFGLYLLRKYDFI